MNRPTRGADKIISSISKMLANGTLKSGDRLPSESKLCEQFNVSRTVVREAIQQLKAIGVIHTITGSGSYITAGDLNGLKNSLEFFAIMTGDTDSWIELLEMRILLETSCVRYLAGEKYTDEALRAIQKALQKMADNKDDIREFSKLDVAFHQTIIQHTGNKIFTAVLSSLENLQLRFAKETYLDENSQQLIHRNYQEHLAIVQAIENRDPDLAEQAMKTHLNATMANLQSFISKSTIEKQ